MYKTLNAFPRYAPFTFSLLFLVIVTSACSPAKHRDWSDDYNYFGDNNTNTTKPKKQVYRSQDCSKHYKIKPGDTLGHIAARCKIKQADIIAANHLNPPYILHVNQELLLPQNSVDWVKNKPSNIAKTNFRWPLNKDKTKSYKYIRDIHGNHSIVINAGLGEAVYAVQKGTVVYSGQGINHFGKMVIIKHANNYLTIYAHNNSLEISEGSKVKKGQLIATVGQTGNVESPQLLLEVRHRGKKTDAKGLFKKPD